MSNAFDEEADLKDLKALPDLWDLSYLELQDVGLISINDIDRKYPNLTFLDLKGNRIFSMDAINILYNLQHLREVNFLRNPLCVNKSLNDMILKSAPQIETVNRIEIHPPGYTIRQKVIELKEQIQAIQAKSYIKDPETGIEISTPLHDLDVEAFLKESQRHLEKQMRDVGSLDQGINNIAQFKKQQEDLLNKNIE